ERYRWYFATNGSSGRGPVNGTGGLTSAFRRTLVLFRHKNPGAPDSRVEGKRGAVERFGLVEEPHASRPGGLVALDADCLGSDGDGERALGFDHHGDLVGELL